MPDDTQNGKINLSRRKILAGTGAIGASGLGAGLGSQALFADQEQFGNNQLVAGELDLKVNWQQTYNGEPVNASHDDDDDDIQDPIRTRGEIATDQGLPVDSPSVETMFRDQFADIPDDFARPLIELNDVKPGDSGEITFSLHLFNNPGYIGISTNGYTSLENGETEPEEAAPDPRASEGDLPDAAMARLWYDDGDNTFEDGEHKIVEGTLRTVLTLLEKGVMISGSPSGTGVDCIPGSTTRYIGLKWWVPERIGNSIQSDSVEFDLGYLAVQCRHAENPQQRIRPIGFFNCPCEPCGTQQALRHCVVTPAQVSKGDIEDLENFHALVSIGNTLLNGNPVSPTNYGEVERIKKAVKQRGMDAWLILRCQECTGYCIVAPGCDLVITDKEIFHVTSLITGRDLNIVGDESADKETKVEITSQGIQRINQIKEEFLKPKGRKGGPGQARQWINKNCPPKDPSDV